MRWQAIPPIGLFLRFTLAVGVAVVVVVWGGGERVAHAQYAPITSRNYNIDDYSGAVVGSEAVVAMAGATIASCEGAETMMVNPASIAVRPETSEGADTWDWGLHADWFKPTSQTDLGNSGGVASTTASSDGLFSFGLLGQWHAWGLGTNLSYRQAVAQPPGGGAPITSQAQVIELLLARSFLAESLTVGLGVKTGSFSLATGTQSLFDITGGALEMGATFSPGRRSFRLGLTGSLPVTGRTPSVSSCNPMSCDGFILPDGVAVPWQLGAGAAYRFAPTAWNHRLAQDYRDERSLMVEGDVMLVGAVPDGVSMDGFLAQEQQRSGDQVSMQVRGGALYEVVPGRLRLRGGSYWEPGRVSDRRGRVHGTAGLEWRFFSFHFFGDPYRLQLAMGGDFASRYVNFGLSIGFWD
jgi:hypothetical protein